MFSESLGITLRAMWTMFRTITPYAIIALVLGVAVYAICKHFNINLFK